MPNRRQFLQAAAVASAASSIGGGVSAAGGERLSLNRIVYDERFEATRAFGRAALRMGAPVRRIAGDVTGLWYEDLRARWAGEPVPIAGLTARDALFCLEQLAWDAGMRVVYHAEHKADPDGRAQHRVLRGMKETTAALDGAGAQWSDEAARILLAYPAKAALGGSVEAAIPTTPDDMRTLVSWIIAPRQGVGGAARSI